MIHLVLFLIALAWWMALQTNGLHDTTWNYLFNFPLALIPLYGGVIGLRQAAHWGRFESAVGRAVSCLSIGLIAWTGGTLVYAYYNLVLHTMVPFPSLADVFYLTSYPLWTAGLVNLFPATGTSLRLRERGGKLTMMFVVAAAIAMSYVALLWVARGNQVKMMLDLAYLLGDTVLLSLTLLLATLANRRLGQFLLPFACIATGLLFYYVSDFAFTYTTTTGTYYIGSMVDLMYAATMSLLATGVWLLDPDRAYALWISSNTLRSAFSRNKKH